MENKVTKTNNEDDSLNEPFLKTLPSLNFMRILINHIFENTFFIMNVCIGIYLLFGYASNERGYLYALVILILPWFINVFLVLNEIYYKTELVYEDSNYKWFQILVITILLQNLPFLSFFVAMCGTIIGENQAKRLYYINSVRIVINASLYNIGMLFLIIRGVITLDNKTCFVDDLGRSACIIYPVIVPSLLEFC